MSLIHAIEMTLQCVNVTGPESPEGNQPRFHLAQWFRSDSVDAPLSVYARLDQPCAPEHAQVL